MKKAPLSRADCPRVYPSRGARVKCYLQRAVATAGVLTLAGCATTNVAARAVEPFAPLGVWYSVETAAAAPSGLARTLERDFGHVARMRLDTVFLKHCDPDDWRLVLETARRHGLRAILSDPAALRAVRSGISQNLPLTPKSNIPIPSTVAGRYLGTIVDEPTYLRARRVASALHAADPSASSCVSLRTTRAFNLTPFDLVIDENERSVESVKKPAPRGTTRLVSRIPCLQYRQDEEATARQWLAAYHQGLLRGAFGGVVFDSFRALPGQWRGIVRGDQPPSPERVAMVRRIAARARHWQPLLRGLRVDPVETIPPLPAHVQARWLLDDHRRYLLLANVSPTRFVRGTATLPATARGSPIVRAVVVPVPEDTMVGPVISVHNGELRIPLTLPPGEAKLFELF